MSKIMIKYHPVKKEIPLPCGWNVLLDNYTGEAVIRVDAHAHIPVDPVIH